MKSMTGFGQGAASDHGIAVQVEISSVNRKTLDIHLSLTKGFSSLEALCQKAVATRVNRGRIHVKVKIDHAGSSSQLELNEGEAERLLAGVNDFSLRHGLKPIETALELIQIPGVFQEASQEVDSADVSPVLTEAVAAALDQLLGMRETEGAELCVQLRMMLEEIKGLVEQVAPLVEEARDDLETKLRDSVRKLGEMSPEREARVLQEIALYAEKTDIREELDRLQAHVNQTQEKLGLEEPVGRALDFLCQEMAREWNTMSVKASRTDINKLALAGKEKVDMFREQVQNVE
jgi:uncharacterized protein (TIGR00255 family)